MNLGTAFLMNNNFREAVSCFEEAQSINDSNSILYFRWSQLYSYDELATFETLALAKDLIRKSQESFAREKIFKTSNSAMLKLLNLHNVPESLEYQRNFVDAQIRNKENEEEAMLRGNGCSNA